MFLTLLGFSAEREVGWKVIIGDGERLLVVVTKIGEARELVCDHGRRESGHRGDGGRVSRLRQCLVIDVIGLYDVGGSFDSRSSLQASNSLGGLLRSLREKPFSCVRIRGRICSCIVCFPPPNNR